MTAADIVLIVAYVVTSVLAFIRMLRRWFDEFGPEWGGVMWSLFAFIPIVGQIIGTLLLIESLDLGTYAPDVPRWVRRIGGQP